MGKLTALILGSITISFSAYTVMSLSYTPLLNWFGPYFGPHLTLILGIIYLIAGSPFNHIDILIAWVLIGVVVGISARKGFRAWSSATLLYWLTGIVLTFTLLSMFGISLLDTSGIAATLDNKLGFISSSLLFIPYGTNIATLIGEPVINGIIPILEGIISSGNVTGTSSFTPLISTIGIHMFENYLIFIISAIITGSIIGKSLKKKLKRKTAVAAIIFILFLFIAMSFSGTVTGNTGSIAATIPGTSAPAVADNQLSMVEISDGSMKINTNNAFIQGNKTGNFNLSCNEGALSLITPNGNLYNVFAMENNHKNSLWSSANLIFGAFAMNNNMSATLQKIFNVNLHGAGGLMPTNAILLAYSGSGNSSQASSLAHSISSGMGISSSLILHINNIPYENKTVSVYIYSSDASNSLLKKGFMKEFGSDYNGSISDMFSNTATSYNLNNCLMISGYVNSNTVKSLDSSISIPSGYVQFTSGLFEYKSYFHSSSDAHTYTLAKLMNYNSNITFEKSSDFSFAGIGYNNKTGNFADIHSYVFDMSSNNEQLYGASPFNTTGSHNTNVSDFSPSKVSATFNEVFPANASYSTTYVQAGTDTVKVNMKFINNDNYTITNLSISQSAFVNHYTSSNAMKVVSGNYSAGNITLAPGEGYNTSYTLLMNGTGTYVIPYTNISYTFQGKNFTLETNATYINIKQIGYVYAMNDIINSDASEYTSLGNTLFTVHDLGISAIDLLLGLIVLMDIGLEVRAFKKYKQKETGK
ncbi:MAG: hypothetical protein QXZ44_04155 [Ferroplasma sp.]